MWKAISYDNSYFDKVIEMSIENFGTENDICDRAFLKHQYFDNPAGNALIELAIDSENGTLAGQYVVTPARFRCFGKDVKCVTSLNTLTRKEYRGQKIFVGLADLTYKRAAQEGYSFCYGAPNQNSYHGFIAKLNFQNICETPLYLRPINPASMIRERTNSSVLATLAKQFSVFFPCKDGESKNIVELDESNYQLMNAFWEKVKDYYPVMGIRDAAYIHYRYMNVPRRIYYPITG